MTPDERTNEMVRSYAAVTGRPAALISVEEYLMFHDRAVKEAGFTGTPSVLSPTDVPKPAEILHAAAGSAVQADKRQNAEVVTEHKADIQTAPTKTQPVVSMVSTGNARADSSVPDIEYAVSSAVPAAVNPQDDLLEFMRSVPG